MRIGVVSLGCAKNQVDLEEILSLLVRNGFEIADDIESSDIILVNTCAFINDAKKESIRAILDMVSTSKKVIVTGCLAQRYLENLKKEIPEVFLYVPISQYKELPKILSDALNIKMEGEIDPTSRVIIPDSLQSYLRISDGCDNRCHYCAIPLIRGGFRSVPYETLTRELDVLENKKTRSISVISQDTTRYGKDIGHSLLELLEDIDRRETFDFVKLMYLYPDEVTSSLISFLKNAKKVARYFDLPVQHFSDNILAKMNRRGTKDDIVSLIKSFRKECPDSILRTTIMVGFPGESEEDFQEVLKYVEMLEFDHLGCFSYSREEGTKAYDMPGQVSEKVKRHRQKKVMELQREISRKLNAKRIGKTYKALVTGYDSENLTYTTCTDIYADDDIDGRLFLYSKQPLDIGSLVECRIVSSSDYDLEAEVTNVLRNGRY